MEIITEILYLIFISPFAEMAAYPDLFFQGIWDAKAVEAGKGCPIFLKRTHKNTLKHLPIETLKKFAIDLS